jgi:hypothetical protein
MATVPKAIPRDSPTDVTCSRRLRLTLMGDTMLGRGVAEELAHRAPSSLVAPEVAALARESDLVLLNLECCISTRGQPWPDEAKPFFFRAPPQAVELLVALGTTGVTLGNNHALDYGYEALEDTFGYLEKAGIAWVGAGPDLRRARQPVVLDVEGLRVAILGVTDHPAEFAATPTRAGVAYADLRLGVPDWLRDAAGSARAQAQGAPDAVVVLPHWGPNMVDAPVPHVRRAADDLLRSGATLVAGHSAHVFHGVAGHVFYDLGDFLDDYARDPVLRNDLGLLWKIELDEYGPRRLEAVPLRLDYCHTALATGEDAAWIIGRLRSACAALGTDVAVESERVVIEWTRSVSTRYAPNTPEDRFSEGSRTRGELASTRPGLDASTSAKDLL